MSDATEEAGHLELATDLTVAWLSNPNTKALPEDVPAFLAAVHRAAVKISTPQAATEAPAEEHVPAVSVRKSLASKDHILSLIDGKAYKSLKRHLGTHGLTPQQYRERYGLKPDYPMVAENYAEVRRALAKKIGLGRKPGGIAAPVAAKAVVAKAAAPVSPVTSIAGAKPARSAKKRAAPVTQAPRAPDGTTESKPVGTPALGPIPKARTSPVAQKAESVSEAAPSPVPAILDQTSATEAQAAEPQANSAD